MVISPKQNEIAATIADRVALQIFLIGALGTSKTFGAAVAMISVAITYPGSLLIVGRKNLTELRRGTLLSFKEAADEMHFEAYHEVQSPVLQWNLDNGSIVMFVELDHTKDRQFSKIKSINATAAMIDEADSVVEGAAIALFSRTGRRNKNGAPRFLLNTCNPNEGWIKDTAYNPWHDPEQYGALPEQVAVIEFEVRDSFLGGDYYAPFETMPNTWRQRYLYNNWNYGDDDTSLFKYRHMDRQHVKTITPALRYAGDDVARTGRDRSVIAMWEGNTLVDIKIVKDRDEQMDTAEQADVLHAYAEENVIGYQNIGVDAVGIGVGVVDSAKSTHQMHVFEFVSGAASTEQLIITVKDQHGKQKRIQIPKYNNKRSEIAFTLAKDLEEGRAFLYDGCPFLADFKKEATMHNYDVKDRVSMLEPKDKVKERLGHSPDIFDAVLMGYERVLKATKTGGAVPSVGGNYSRLYRQGQSGLMSV